MPEMLKLCRVTKVKVFFLVLVYVFNFDLFEFSAGILSKGLLQYFKRIYNWQLFNMEKVHNTKSTDISIIVLTRKKRNNWK